MKTINDEGQISFLSVEDELDKMYREGALDTLIRVHKILWPKDSRSLGEIEIMMELKHFAKEHAALQRALKKEIPRRHHVDLFNGRFGG
jgi:hypothetical protein